MSFGAVASIAGGLIGASAAGDAADAQAEAAAKSDATQRYMYDTTRADNAPFLANGTAASNRLAYLLGLAPSPTGGAAGAAGETADQIRARLLPQFTRAAAPAAPAPFVLRNSQFGQDEAAAAPATAGPSVDEAGLNAEIQRVLAEQKASAATAASSAAPAAGGEAGSLLRRFTMADLNADPVYQSGLQFGLSEGEKGIQRQAAATGSSLSGATLKALSRFGTDYGSTKANEAYNRFTNDQTGIYNKLAGVAGSGQTASAQVGAAGANAANNISQSQQGVGNSRAASSIIGANNVASGINGAVSAYRNANPASSSIYQAAFSNTPVGSAGFGSGLAYGNQDLGLFA